MVQLQRRHGGAPGEPLLLFDVEAVLVQARLGERGGRQTLALLAGEPRQLLDEGVHAVAVAEAVLLNHGRAQGPHQAKHERRLEHGRVHDDAVVLLLGNGILLGRRRGKHRVILLGVLPRGRRVQKHALQHVAQLRDEVQVRLRDGLLRRLADNVALDALHAKVHAFVHVLAHQSAEHVRLLLVHALVAPGPRVRLVVEVLGVHVHHAAPGDGRGRGVLQVRHLEQQLDVVDEPDALAVR
mmetsp:Transcript_11639/g.49743  ORF Transcript_11639/g.49743 Transcript_11639/m.49743 type:complete len:240 (+) Transcript_11639:3104-3823(+)